MATNKQIAEILSKTADLLEIKGENPFKVRAYRNAARIVENSAKDFDALVKKGFDLTKLPGIGHDLSEYIKEIVHTGEFHKLKELQKEIPSSLTELLSIEGLGPKRVKLLYETLGVKSMEDLKKYALSGKLRQLPGFGPKLIEKILKGVKQLKKAGIRFLWAEIEPVANEIKEYLLRFEGVETVEIAGSFRRKKESVGDLDILVIAKDYYKVSEYFVKFYRVKEVYSKGLTRSTVFLDNGLQIDLRAVTKESYGAALHYFTGSKAHNIEIRKLAQQKGLKINEYGVFEGNKKIASLKEEDVYKSVGLEYIEPELRENRGEIQASMKHALPVLVCEKDLKGLMCRIDDISESEAVIESFFEAGYEYVIANFFKNDEILKNITSLRKKFEHLKVLFALTLPVSKKEDLFLNSKISESFDFVTAEIQNGNISKNALTSLYERVIKTPYVKMVMRPSLRRVLKSDGIDLDWDFVFEKARKHGVAMDICSQPEYMDLSDVLIKRAVEKNVDLCISAFKPSQAVYGLNQARRGWCEAEKLLNSRNYERMKRFWREGL
ncbi:helix-hairpin-helix domain-containing protein [Nautilia sp.]